MIIVVIGTHNSGKSVLAEDLAVQTGDPFRYYLATMQAVDAAGRQRVLRHRMQREGKGFVTIEIAYDSTKALLRMAHASEATVLLECVANLVGNEMHRAGFPEAGSEGTGLRENPVRSIAQERFARSILKDIQTLAAHVRNLIIVTDVYEKDGAGYDDSTRQYVKLLDLVNEKLLEYVDRVCDVRDAQICRRSPSDRPQRRTRSVLSSGDAE